MELPLDNDWSSDGQRLRIAEDRPSVEGLDVRLNANNLTNESYVASCASLNFCYLGEERNVAATVSYQF
ncbi:MULTISPECIES: hypothetical protein [unclassified Pseudomonas]|uniref:hypothetical protein n=1 Tax=Pseudomonas sp. PMCC200344 TaxID=3042028 RepID=UPI0032C48FAE